MTVDGRTGRLETIDAATLIDSATTYLPSIRLIADEIPVGKARGAGLASISGIAVAAVPIALDTWSRSFTDPRDLATCDTIFGTAGHLDQEF